MRDRSNSNLVKSSGMIYVITLDHQGTKYQYIGRTRQAISKRLEDHTWNLRNGTHKNIKMQLLFDTILDETKTYPKLIWKIIDSGNYTNKELSIKEEWYTELYKEKYGSTILNVHVGDQIPNSRLEQMAETTRSLWQNKDYAEKVIKRIRENAKDPLYRKKISESLKSTLSTPEERLKLSLRAKQQHADPSFKKAHSERIKKSWEDPKRRKQMSESTTERYKDKAVREAHGKKMKEVLSDPKLRLKLSLNQPKSKSVTIDGITYPSQRQAIKETGLSESMVRKLAQEQNPNIKPHNTKKQSITLDGVTYNSISEASNKLKVSRATIRRRLINPA